MNLSAALAFPQGGTTGGGRLGVGGSRAFAGASVGFVTSDVQDRTAPAFGADGGLSVPIGSGSARLCPVVSGSFRYGPKIGELLYNGVRGSFGLRLGGVVGVSPNFAVVPFVGGSVAYLREEVEWGNQVAVLSDGGGFGVGGLGFQFAGVFTVAPTVSVPIGFASTRASFGIQAGLGFGAPLKK